MNGYGALVRALALALLYLRKARRALSRFVMWQWSKMSLVSAKLHTMLIEKINGNNHTDD